MELNQKQKQAVEMAEAWFRNPDKQIFKLAGYAGTGKTTTATTIAKMLTGDADNLFCAFTGKAACVMRQKGMPGRTIHSAIYNFKRKYDSATKRYYYERHLKDSLPYKLIIVDEASMVGADVAADLLSFGIPVLAIGDPGQLPPVGDCFSNLLQNPDLVLDEIMRQADGNRIPLFAMQLRKGWEPKAKDFPPGPDVKVVRPDFLIKHFPKLIEKADQIICAKNKTREVLNDQARKFYRREERLNEGEKIVRRENDWERIAFSQSIGDLSLVNGMTGTASNVRSLPRNHFLFDFTPNCAKDATFHDLGYNKFDYAYAITCHASQGSEYPFVVVVDDSWNDYKNPDFQAEWRYTAATRAKEKLLWVTNR